MNTNSKKSNESGMVMIFVIASIFTLIVLLGLFLDVGTMMIAKRDRERTARLVSSEAISVYNRDNNVVAQDRGRAAQIASQQLADTNLNLQFAKSFFANPSAGQDIGLLDVHGSTGALLPGSWFFNPTGVFNADKTCKYDGFDPCPCKGDTWNGPCFRALRGWDDELKDSVNAFSTNLYTSESSKLKTTFIGIVGQKEVSLNTQSTIALRPLNVVVLVDLSRFVDEETHVPYDMVGLGVAKPTVAEHFNPLRFAYEIDTTTRAACSPSETWSSIPPLQPNGDSTSMSAQEKNLTCHRQEILLDTNATSLARWNRIQSTCTLVKEIDKPYNWNDYIFNWPYQMGSPINISFAERLPDHANYYHAKYDYRCLDLNFRRSTPPGAPDDMRPYLIDVRRTDTYKGPEPLNTFIQATRESIQKIKDRNLRGDSISILGFDWDAEIKKRRIEPLNPIEDALKFSSDLEEVFKDPYKKGTDEHFANLKSFYEKTAFIPRNGNRYLSIPYALNEAYKTLQSRKNFATADNMIILLTTGLTNCKRDNNTQICGQDAGHFNESVKQVVDYAKDTLAKKGVILHTLIRSPRATPLTKVIRTPGRCILEKDLAGINTQDSYQFPLPADLETPLDKQTARFSAGQLKVDTPFLIPNNLARASLVTGGVWAPIRPKCGDKDLNGKCTKLDQAITTCNNGGTPDANIIDANNNLLCDPTCDSPEDQTTSYISNMFDLTPLLPVGEGVVVSASN